MKRTTLISVITLLVVMTSCVGGHNKTSHDSVITVDVSTNYPNKELVLQDFMDVEYIALESTDEFITQGIIKAIGKKIIIATNRLMDGNIFVFDRHTGKGLRIINHLGQGPEEYTQVYNIILDEDCNEMFVIDYSARNIITYDLYGNYKRNFKFDGENSYYHYIFDYDRDHLICFKGYLPQVETKQSSHVLVDKQDGSIAQEIKLPASGIITPVIIEGEATITPNFHLTIPNHNSWVIMRPSSDTIYNLSGGILNPIIARTPSIHSMNPEIFLFPTIITDRYYFMQTMKKEIDFKTFKGFPTTDLVYVVQENSIFEYTVYNDDFSSKKQVSLGQYVGGNSNQEIATCVTLNAFDLVEAYNKGELKGKLKDIAQKLDEESNSVIMLVKYRKEAK